MTWTEIRRWAKENGYQTSKHKDGYDWSMVDNPDSCGTTSSVSKLATAIFNHMTDNKFIQHQKDYKDDSRF